MMRPWRILLGVGLLLLSLQAGSLSMSVVQAASPGIASVPILLYHSIPGQSSTTERYKVSVENFELQMQQLANWGYTTISIQDLVDHLYHGGPMPHRPVVITFDDGYRDVYDNAFPIMQSYGFTGTVYIVANRLNADGFLDREALKTLVENGWEIGSHSMTHTDLTQNHSLVRTEILQSRLDLNDALGIEVLTFAYPFGLLDGYISSKVYDYGYRSAVGVGILSTHSAGTVFNLSRREVRGGADLKAFMSLLPWSGRLSPAPIRKYLFD
jgi:peptidoglycan/xylan/chitin deacetylase (PgdA/CDA1 family)